MSEALKAGLEDAVVTTSEVCFIDGHNGVLKYRGYDIHDLARNSTFEETCYLLWHGKLPTEAQLAEHTEALRKERDIPAPVIELLRTMPKSEPPMNALRTAVSYLSAFDPDSSSDEPAARLRMARRLTAKFPAIVGTIAQFRKGEQPVKHDPKLTHAEHFLHCLSGKKPDPDSARAMDVALVLHAEHDFNASTFTARVIAATLSDMYSAVTGAIGALKGPLHGGANTGVMVMLMEIGSLDKVDSYIGAKLAKKEKIMGMGHRVYKTTDPRAEELFQLSKKMGERIGNTKWLDMSERVRDIVHAQKGLYANVDFYSASTYYTMGIDPELFTLIFAVSRISGWTAHVIEQLSHNRLMRPLSEYVGPMNLTYVPVTQRS